MQDIVRIGVLSDTHMPRTADSLPRQVVEGLRGVDIILHAGDITEESALAALSKIAPIKAVAGNMDSPHLKKSLPKKEVIEMGGCRIGLIHGYGPPFGMVKRIRREFDQVDAIVFGHSHSIMNKTVDGVLFFNPGSPTDNIFAKENAYGIITVKGGRLKGEIIKI